jgi:type I restriction-modification system DNA methylase subunit
MYNLTKNNYHLNPKNSNIYTPLKVSEFIFELLRDKGKFRKKEQIIIVDPCVGQGNLLAP